MTQEEISGKKYVVRLSGEERAQLESMLRKGKHSAMTLVGGGSKRCASAVNLEGVGDCQPVILTVASLGGD